MFHNSGMKVFSRISELDTGETERRLEPKEMLALAVAQLAPLQHTLAVKPLAQISKVTLSAGVKFPTKEQSSNRRCSARFV
jgi:hypothetical protein